MRGSVARGAMSVAGGTAVLAVYVSAYYGLVNPVWLLNPVPDLPAVAADYRSGGMLAEWLFLPMEHIDRRLRPEWWVGFPARPPWDRPEE